MSSAPPNPTSLPLLFRALSFAADHHRFGRRKGEEASPFINHPIEVAAELAQVGVVDLEILAAALLHDTLEDTDATPVELETEFGQRVRSLVEALTDDPSLTSRERKAAQLERAGHLEPDAKGIRIADKICNARDVGSKPARGWTLERRHDYLDWTEQVVERCKGVLPELDARYDSVLNEARAQLEAVTLNEGPR
jgi:guanosine-3',5'-bis(diphosphate) 3'-pyrophosphohydrolase